MSMIKLISAMTAASALHDIWKKKEEIEQAKPLPTPEAKQIEKLSKKESSARAQASMKKRLQQEKIVNQVDGEENDR